MHVRVNVVALGIRPVLPGLADVFWARSGRAGPDQGRIDREVRSMIRGRVAQHLDLDGEVVEGGEAAVDGGEAQIGDLVEAAQRLEDGPAHLDGVDLGAAAGPYGLFDLLGEQ